MEKYSRHRWGYVQEYKHGTIGDICVDCSNLDTGYLVPVSFCSEAKEECDRFYGDIDLLNMEKDNAR